MASIASRTRSKTGAAGVGRKRKQEFFALPNNPTATKKRKVQTSNNVVEHCQMSYKELQVLCKHENLNVPCNAAKQKLCEELGAHFNQLTDSLQQQQQAKKGIYAPEKYLAGLNAKERRQRIAEIKKGAKTDHDDPEAYKTFKTDLDPKTGKLRKTKTSSYTKAFYEMFPESGKSVAAKASTTGVPKDILQQVYNRGLAAWRTGRRPGATQGQWAHARVHSFLMKGCAYYWPDHKLVESAKKRSKKARDHWSSIECICRKGCTFGKR